MELTTVVPVTTELSILVFQAIAFYLGCDKKGVLTLGFVARVTILITFISRNQGSVDKDWTE